MGGLGHLCAGDAPCGGGWNSTSMSDGQVFSRLRVRPAFHGGGWNSTTKSDGQVLQLCRRLHPQFTAAQYKGMLAASPKLAALIEVGVEAPVAAGILKEAQRLKIAPAFGSAAGAQGGGGSASADKGKGGLSKSDGGELGWQKVKKGSRKGSDSQKAVEKPCLPALELVADQFQCDGKSVPVRRSLLLGVPGVSLVSTSEDFSAEVSRVAGKSSQVPQLLVAPRRYDLDAVAERTLVVPPVQVVLQLRIGGVPPQVAESHVWVYQLGKEARVVSQGVVLEAPVAASVAFRLEPVPSLLRGRGVWVPRDVTASS
eukprot:6458062-Amphidinium_carterae.1